MGILQDLKQSTDFTDLRDEVIVNIRLTNNFIITRNQALFKKFDITHQQYNILRILKGSKVPITTSEIQERMIERRSDVSRLIDRLMAKDLIVKTQRTKDMRKVDIDISTKGLTRLEEFEKSTLELVRQSVNLEPDEMRSLSLLLDKLRDESAPTD